jgi:C4-dicarboxylate-specific signal transduction histidine kinase
MSAEDDEVFDHDDPLQAVAGVLASSLVSQLSRPLCQLREGLAVMMDEVERHLAEAEGPAPYPWKSLMVLRQELADAYLLSRETARIASELGEAVTGGAVEPVDMNHLVEAALELVRHRFGSDTEVFVDLGSLPPVRAAAGQMLLVIAKLLLCCADSAALMEGSAVSIQTRHEGEVVVIHVADNGKGLAEAARSAHRVVEPIMRELGGSFEGVSEPDQGTFFECRLPCPSR